MLDDECTTDALPSPPRNQNNSPNNQNNPPSNNKTKSKVSESESDKINEETYSAQSRLSQAFIYIKNSSQIQVGDITHHHGKIEPNRGPPIRETEKIRSLKKSSKPVTSRDIDILSQHFGYGWEVTARALGYSDGQIYQFENKYNFRSVKQTAYDLMKDWIENTGPKATVGILAQILWDTKQREALKLWSEYSDEN